MPDASFVLGSLGLVALTIGGQGVVYESVMNDLKTGRRSEYDIRQRLANRPLFLKWVEGPITNLAIKHYSKRHGNYPIG